jgi:hypothetical protein
MDPARGVGPRTLRSGWEEPAPRTDAAAAPTYPPAYQSSLYLALALANLVDG